MEVILLENIKKLGKIGSKVKVANGFARNYLLKNNKALVASKENWGLRQLAYPIKNFKKGYYTILYFSGEPVVIQELEKIERIDSNILRFMTIKIKNIPEENSELVQKEESK